MCCSEMEEGESRGLRFPRFAKERRGGASVQRRLLLVLLGRLDRVRPLCHLKEILVDHPLSVITFIVSNYRYQSSQVSIVIRGPILKDFATSHLQ